MSDTSYQKFQHYGTNAERIAFTPDPAAGIQPIYIWYETDTGKTFLYHTTWIVIGITEDQADALYAPLVHASQHNDGGTDPIDVTGLAGYPGGTTDFLRADGTFSALPAPVAVRRQITVTIDGGTSVITTGFKTSISLPVAGTLKKWRILADVSGSIVIDVWKDTYVNYPPTGVDTITAAAKPTLSSATSAESTSLTGWTTAFSAGDILGFNVDSVATVKKVTLALEFE